MCEWGKYAKTITKNIKNGAKSLNSEITARMWLGLEGILYPLCVYRLSDRWCQCLLPMERVVDLVSILG